MSVVTDMRGILRICRDEFGLVVRELDGWTTRGKTDVPFVPKYSIVHHTAVTVDTTRLLIEGRTDLSGPLCNFEGRKDGSVSALAALRANHAGVATVHSYESYGTEWTGPFNFPGTYGPDAFPEYAAIVKHHAAICMWHRWDTSRVLGHKEIAPNRKINPYFDMDLFRKHVDAARAGKFQEDVMTEAQMTELKEYIKNARDEGVRMTDHGEPDVPGRSNNLKVVRADLASIKAMVGALNDDEAVILAAYREGQGELLAAVQAVQAGDPGPLVALIQALPEATFQRLREAMQA